MKAVILLGGVSSRLSALTHNTPRAMLSLADRPVLSYMLDHYQKMGVDEFYVPLHPKLHDVRLFLEQEKQAGRRLHVVKEPKWMGTAGVLHLLRQELGKEPFYLLNGNAFSFLNLDPLKNALSTGEGEVLIGVASQADGSLVFESQLHTPIPAMIVPPAVLDLIPPSRYFDFREQLFPLLQEKKFPVRWVPLSGYFNELKNMNEYLDANFEIAHLGHKNATAISSSARVAASAKLVGSVFVGPNSEIGPNCTIEGPAVIGPGCVVGSGATIERSVLTSNVRVGDVANIRNSVLLHKSFVKPRTRMANTISFDSLEHKLFHFSTAELRTLDSHWNLKPGRGSRTVRLPHAPLEILAKRIFDLSVVILSAPFWLPLTVLFAGLVKLTSRGPMFYIEKRVGQHGVEFPLFKLRSMHSGAHLKQIELRGQNISDGPMFKIVNDPRVTPLGRFIRRTSLDELPQMFNVLRGEMSLVGPRPLTWKEMQWKPAWRDIRLRVLPGITGLWQARARDSEQFSDWITMDLDYIRHWSFRFDMQILIETVISVVKRKAST
jgi:lipopolysaccharide/colanic/teichoic acid biosynthesis glycosyltransferase/NDP-sugar pyrophosphorylase family protein